jgi:hypothetical protein
VDTIDADDYNALLADVAQMRARNEALVFELKTAKADHLGATLSRRIPDILSAWFRRRIEVDFDDQGEVKFLVLDDSGKPRSDTLRSLEGRFRPVDLNDLLAEAKTKHAKYLDRDGDDAGPAKGETASDLLAKDPTKVENLTAHMALIKKMEGTDVPRPLSDQDRVVERARNPFAKATWNGTRATELIRRDPKFADELRLAAKAAGVSVLDPYRPAHPHH